MSQFSDMRLRRAGMELRNVQVDRPSLHIQNQLWLMHAQQMDGWMYGWMDTCVETCIPAMAAQLTACVHGVPRHITQQAAYHWLSGSPMMDASPAGVVGKWGCCGCNWCFRIRDSASNEDLQSICKGSSVLGAGRASEPSLQYSVCRPEALCLASSLSASCMSSCI